MSKPQPELERWRNIPGYSGLYQVSDLGRVASVPRAVKGPRGRVNMLRAKPVKAWRCGKSEYLSVALWRSKSRKVYRLARLVLLAFEGPPPFPHWVASHEPDPDVTNNRLTNLKWRSPEENELEKQERYKQEAEIDDIADRESEEGIDLAVAVEDDQDVPF